jgi:hypothetical protein
MKKYGSFSDWPASQASFSEGCQGSRYAEQFTLTFATLGNHAVLTLAGEAA